MLQDQGQSEQIYRKRLKVYDLPGKKKEKISICFSHGNQFHLEKEHV